MGRRKTIDRNQVLDVAEEIVSSQGAGALTIGTVAEAAGITKGGVQSCFSTKEALITAMLERWLAEDRKRFERLAGANPSEATRLRAHIETTRGYGDLAHARVSSLLAVLLQQPDQVAATRQWYQERIPDMNPDSDDGRRARLAFLANEGAFYLRFLGLVPMQNGKWGDIFADIEALAKPCE